MTTKVYKTARGKQVDVGSMRLQNENVRAVGNMGVNARGDRIDAQGNIIDSRNQQLQRRIQRQTNVSDGPVQTNHQHPTEDQIQAPAMATGQPVVNVAPAPIAPAADPLPVADTIPAGTSITETTTDTQGGLAGAIARAKTVKQELEKTSRQQQQDQPVRKI